MNKENDLNLIEFLQGYVDKPGISFHMPGHKGGKIFRRFGFDELLSRLPELDITEIEGADNLFRPEGPLRETMNRYKKLYGAKESFLSVGGSSAGLMAAIMAACKKSDKILIARNSHKSVYNGVSLSGAEAVYVYPEVIDGVGISGEVRADAVKKAFDKVAEENKDLTADNPIKAVVITSPNYYGVLSDIRSIAEICHERGAILIVDQAHGAHLGLAEKQGADIVVNSIHKTLASFTQTAIVNLCSDRVEAGVLASKLEMIQSSSPSYMLMLSLDINAEIMEEHGDELLKEWSDNLKSFYEGSKKIRGLKIASQNKKGVPTSLLDVIEGEGYGFDPSKILIDMTELGLSGKAVYDYLYERGINPELFDARIAMAMTGIGNTEDNYKMLLDALRKLSEEPGFTSSETGQGEINSDKSISEYLKIERPIGDQSGEEALIYWKEAAGMVSAGNLTPYPPGIPLIVRGEIMDEASLEFLFNLRASGVIVSGMSEDGKVLIFCEK